MSTATQPAPQDLLTYEEAAAYLGVTTHGIHHAIRQGNLKPRKFPHDVRKYLTRQQLDDYRAGRHRQAVAPSSSASSPATLDNATSAAAAEVINMAASPFLQLAEKITNGIAGPMSNAVAAALAAYSLQSPKVNAG